MRRLRATPGLVRDVVMYGVRSGRWWTPLVLIALAVAVALATATAQVLPVSVYVLF